MYNILYQNTHVVLDCFIYAVNMDINFMDHPNRGPSTAKYVWALSLEHRVFSVAHILSIFWKNENLWFLVLSGIVRYCLWQLCLFVLSITRLVCSFSHFSQSRTKTTWIAHILKVWSHDISCTQSGWYHLKPPNHLTIKWYKTNLIQPNLIFLSNSEIGLQVTPFLWLGWSWMPFFNHR